MLIYTELQLISLVEPTDIVLYFDLFQRDSDHKWTKIYAFSYH